MTGTEVGRRTLLKGSVAAAALAASRWLEVPEGATRSRPAPVSMPPALPLPQSVVAGYWPYWSGPALSDIDAGYNTLYLFHAEPVGGPPGTTGAVHWKGPRDHRFTSELAHWRDSGGRALLTVGGESAQLILDSRSKTEVFLDSVRRIRHDLGGLDGLDWNNYEGVDDPPTTEMIRASLALKAEFGSAFSITTPPAPHSLADMAHCRAMLDAGALDLVSPQFYGAPGLDRPRFIRDSVRAWADHLGDERVLAIGLRVGTGDGKIDAALAVQAWEQAVVAAPDLRGAFNWEMAADALAGWGFARHLGPRLARGRTHPLPLGPALLPVLGRPRLSESDGRAFGGATDVDAPVDRSQGTSSPHRLPGAGPSRHPASG